MLGGESQRECAFSFWACSAIAHCTGKGSSYLQPISGSLQKPIGEGPARRAPTLQGLLIVYIRGYRRKIAQQPRPQNNLTTKTEP
jgi:hypothetical protein